MRKPSILERVREKVGQAVTEAGAALRRAAETLAAGLEHGVDAEEQLFRQNGRAA